MGIRLSTQKPERFCPYVFGCSIERSFFPKWCWRDEWLVVGLLTQFFVFPVSHCCFLARSCGQPPFQCAVFIHLETKELCFACILCCQQPALLDAKCSDALISAKGCRLPIGPSSHAEHTEALSQKGSGAGCLNFVACQAGHGKKTAFILWLASTKYSM